jgi:uncharacterized protein (TIGR02996 family)
VTLLDDPTDHAALLRGIAAAPGDPLPRLVYADWLDEFAAEDYLLAREEWIRLCVRPGREVATHLRMPPAAYAWLYGTGNARRLVGPGLAEDEHLPPYRGAEWWFKPQGRRSRVRLAGFSARMPPTSGGG